jgi:hypothetical protein
MEKPPRRSTKFMTAGWLISLAGAFWAVFGVWPATQVSFDRIIIFKVVTWEFLPTHFNLQLIKTF